MDSRLRFHARARAARVTLAGFISKEEVIHSTVCLEEEHYTPFFQ